jgi:hypothetical protein
MCKSCCETSALSLVSICFFIFIFFFENVFVFSGSDLLDARLPRVACEWLVQCGSTHRHVELLETQNNIPGLDVARVEAEEAFKALNKEKSLAAMCELERVESVRPLDVRFRHEKRCATFQVIREERVATAFAILTSRDELSCLGNVASLESSSKNSKGENVSIESIRDCNERLKHREENVQWLLVSLQDCESRLHALKYDPNSSSEELECLVFQIACDKEKLTNLVVNDTLLTETTANVDHAILSVTADNAARTEMLNVRVADLNQYLELLDQKYFVLNKAIASFDQIEPLLARVEGLFRELQRKKKEVTYFQLAVELGHMSGDVLDRAKQELSVARRLYTQTVGELLNIRLCGYPELKCAAASAQDLFKEVPRISFAELDLDEKAKPFAQGAFADVFKVDLPVSGVCAFKRLRSNVPESVLMKEASAMWEFRHHPNIVKLLKVCVEEGNQGLLLELVEGGSLGALLQRKEPLSHNRRHQILHDVATGLAFMHEHSQVHMDVKAENVLLTCWGGAKLADFGASKILRDTIRVGTAVSELSFRWSAPEVLESNVISDKSDVWSFGMLVYETLTGLVPFHDVPDMRVAVFIVSGQLPSNCTDELALNCWKRDPAQRPSAAQLVEAIPVNRDCLICFQPFPLSVGVMCGPDETCFSCVPCLENEMKARLMINDVLTEGVLECRGCKKGVFDLKMIKNPELLREWLAAQLRTKEHELRAEFRVELDVERKKWDAKQRETNKTIINTTKQCPKCHLRWGEPIKCNHVTCHKGPAGGCGYEFCWLCLCDYNEVRRRGNSAHEKSCRLFA